MPAWPCPRDGRCLAWTVGQGGGPYLPAQRGAVAAFGDRGSGDHPAARPSRIIAKSGGAAFAAREDRGRERKIPARPRAILTWRGNELPSRLRQFLIAGLICGSCLAPATAFGQMAFGQMPAAPFMLPCSPYEPLPSPPLQTGRLSPGTRQAVQNALGDAAQGKRKAADAERVIAAAQRVADRGREAARKTEAGQRGYGTLSLSFDGRRCRYSGEVARRRATGTGVMVCDVRRLEGAFRGGRPEGLVVEQTPRTGFIGEYRNGNRNGLGGDYRIGEYDAYEGEYRDGVRIRIWRRARQGRRYRPLWRLCRSARCAPPGEHRIVRRAEFPHHPLGGPSSPGPCGPLGSPAP